MSRWWSNAEESRQVLALVDGSDVEQGVGTAVLGYHGLAAGALEPLTRRTLMDVSAVRHALAGVDLEPVAKALGAATRPVMGDAADRYGEIMADDLHRQAIEATERLLLSLTNTGMPWPTAIERVATVHGVPLERLGQAAAKLGAPALTPLVRADIGDRALMDYAAHRGVRENTVSDVSKAMNADAFDPNEHPRGAKGQFRRKPARKQPGGARSIEAREARDARDSRQRRDVRAAERGNVRRQMAEEAQVAPRSLMSMLADVFARDEPVANETVARMSFRDLQGRKDPRGRSDQGNDNADPGAANLTKPIAKTKDEYRIDGERTYLIRKEFADQIIQGGVVVGRLEDAMHKMGWLSPDETKALINQSVGHPEQLDGYVVLEIVDDIPVNGGGKRDAQVQLARSARLVASDPEASMLDAYDVDDTYSIPVQGNAKHPNPRYQRDHLRKIPVLRVVAANADAYDKHWDDGPPDVTSKAFDQFEHPRGAKGRFRNKPDRLEPVMPDRRSREAREARDSRDKRDRRSSRGNARRELAPPPKQQASLMSILAEKIKSDPLAQDLDSVDELAARRERKTFRQLVKPANDRARVEDKPRSSVFDGLDLKKAQVISLTDGQVLALDQVGQQDINPLVAMAEVLADTNAMGNDPYSALLRMRDAARSRISIAKKGRHLPMGFTEDESFDTSDAAWEAAMSFQSALEDGIKDSNYVMWTDGGTGKTKMRGKHAIDMSNPYVEGFADEQGNHRYRAKTVALSVPMDVPTISLGTTEEMAMIRDGVALPDDFIEGETTFREMATLVGMHPDMINSTPDFMIRTIRPVFGQNDD